MAGSGFLLSGCLATQRDLDTVKLQLQELSTVLVQIQSNQAELAGKMDELNHSLSVSNENVSQVDNQFSQLSAKLDDMAASVRTGTSADANAPQASSVLPSDLFTESKGLLDSGAFESAAMGFKLYISKYPQNENIEQAYMYLGDAYAAQADALTAQADTASAQKQAKSAAIAYATVLQKFPKSKFTAAARLKYARNIVPLGKTEEAKKYLNSVVKEFPSSEEAKLAKAELAKLK